MNDCSFERREDCPVCSSRDLQILYEEPFTEGATWQFIARYYAGAVPQEALECGSFSIAHCNGCAFIFQREVLNNAGMQKLYDEWICNEKSRSKQVDSTDQNAAEIANQVQVITDLVGRPASKCQVLDVGMGWGNWCQMAQAHGYQAFGLELSRVRQEHAQKRGVTVIETLDSQESRFDFVNCEQVLEHVPHPRQLLETIRDVLRPGGVTRISVPNARGIKRKIESGQWRPAKDCIHPLEHINAFTNKTLRHCMEHTGFHLIKQPRILSMSLSPLTWLRRAALPTYLTHRATNLYFKKSHPPENHLTDISNPDSKPGQASMSKKAESQ